MLQLVAIIVALILIPILIKLKVSSGYALIIAAAAAGFIGGLSLLEIGTAFIRVFTEWSSLSSVLIVIEIAMLGALMTHYGLFKRAEDSLKTFLPWPRLIIMLLPSVIGILQVPGGAALSAPFCNNLGKEMGLTPSQRADTNVICRHVFMLVTPFSTYVILVAGLAPTLNLLPFLLLSTVFAAITVIGSYVFFLRNSTPVELPRVSAGERVKHLGIFLLMLSPIWVVVALNLLLDISLVIAVPVAAIAVFFLSDKKDFLSSVAKTYKWSLTTMIVGVYFFQNISQQMEDLLQLVHQLLTNDSQLIFLIVVALASLLFGFASGLMLTALGVLTPIIVSIFGGGIPLVINMFYVFCWSYVGYVFSPLHMCQILSNRECGCSFGEAYRTYLPMIVLLSVSPVVLYLLLSVLFL